MYKFLPLYKYKKVNTSIYYISSYLFLEKKNEFERYRQKPLLVQYIRFIRRHSMFLNKRDEYDIMKPTWGNIAH